MKRKIGLLSKKISLRTAVISVIVAFAFAITGSVMAASFNGASVSIENYYEAEGGGNLGGQVHNVYEKFDAGIGIDGDATIDDLTVTGSTTLNDLTVSGYFAFDDPLTLYSTLSAEGITSTSTLAVTGITTLSAMLNGTTIHLTGASELGGAITASSSITIAGETQAQRVIQGGAVIASSSSNGADTLLAATICDYSQYETSVATGNYTNIAITLPATSTLIADCLDTEGDSLFFLFSNTSSKVASTTTITANTDYDLVSDDANGDIIAGGDTARITIYRKASKMIAIVDPYTSAE